MLDTAKSRARPYHCGRTNTRQTSTKGIVLMPANVHVGRSRGDFFLKIDNVKGESLDHAHGGEIDVESFSWGETNSTSIGSATGGAGSGKVKFDEFVFTTHVSSASPQLALMCASGAHIPNVVLTVRKAGGKAEDYYKIYFQTVFITRYRSVGVGGDDVIPRDEVTCVFGEYRMEYRPQNKDGSLGTAIVNGWNQIMNKKS
jgi:type VI secretion system secreted protein Hcp